MGECDAFTEASVKAAMVSERLKQKSYGENAW